MYGSLLWAVRNDVPNSQGFNITEVSIHYSTMFIFLNSQIGRLSCLVPYYCVGHTVGENDLKCETLID